MGGENLGRIGKGGPENFGRIAKGVGAKIFFCVNFGGWEINKRVCKDVSE